MKHCSRLATDIEDNAKIRNDRLSLAVVLVPSQLSLRDQAAENVEDFHFCLQPCPLAHIVQCRLQHIMALPEMIPRNICGLNCVAMSVNGDLAVTLTPDKLTLAPSPTGGRETEIDRGSSCKLLVGESFTSPL